jgi:hypothetical protein
VVSGQWSVVSGQLSVVSGQLSVVSCQLSVVSCQLSVVSGWLSPMMPQRLDDQQQKRPAIRGTTAFTPDDHSTPAPNHHDAFIANGMTTDH